GRKWVEVDLGTGSALVEQLLAGELERRVGCGGQPDGPGRCHAEAGFIELALRVAVDIPGRLVSACEPGADHRARRPGGERQSDVPRIPDTAVRPHMPAELASFGSAVENGAELRPADSRAHPGCAHRARPDADLDDVGA